MGQTTAASRVSVAMATRQGTAGDIADAVATFTAADLTTAAAVVDCIGHTPQAQALAPVLAEVAARTGAVRGALAGLLNAALLVADPGADEDTPDAVAVVAVAAPGADTTVVWCGDCRAYGWKGTRLQLYSNDHTGSQQLEHVDGVPLKVADPDELWLRVSLSRATPATAYEAVIPAGEQVILTSNGIHERLPHQELETLVGAHHSNPQPLADMIVAAARHDDDGHRDDASVVILTGAGAQNR
jgi:hypothetical protein